MKTLALVGAALGIALGCSHSASASGGSHHPILSDFKVRCNETGMLEDIDTELALCIPLHDNRAALFYKTPTSGGFTVKVTLYLPSGVEVTSSRVWLGPPGLAVQSKPTYSDLHYKMVTDSSGVMRPTWVFHHLEQSHVPIWYFTLSLPPENAKVCVRVVAAPVRLAGAPVQQTHACYVR